MVQNHPWKRVLFGWSPSWNNTENLYAPCFCLPCRHSWDCHPGSPRARKSCASLRRRPKTSTPQKSEFQFRRWNYFNECASKSVWLKEVRSCKNSGIHSIPAGDESLFLISRTIHSTIGTSFKMTYPKYNSYYYWTILTTGIILVSSKR